MAASVERPQTIQTMIDGVERYNPDNAVVLEEYLAEQCKNGEYDLTANLALLKLYQLNPQLSKVHVIVNILAQSLTAIPKPDYNLCMYLLTDYVEVDEVKRLTHLQQLLEQSRYAEFWKTLENDKALIKDIVGFEDTIRQVIALVVSMSYQTIATSVLESYFALTGDAFKQFCEKHQWQLNGNTVSIPINEDNEAKTVVVRENIKFEQLTKVIGYSNEM
ncbi:armadillo-type protein [Zychaea mexicana]|uniref:armadillo-type protein n=1 Tax=Zychaea mexicana TaxID=64656 RepID=UPI0022FE61FA|nr:armadillo-type protein [Zychaea mexicana]KAI9489831.1 armadillo-type protein [Zychaea mexicana]